MKRRRQSGTRIRVLRWLLAVLTLAGAGVLQGGHCLDDVVPGAATSHSAAAGQHAHDHEQVPADHHGSSDTVLDVCGAQPAPATAATVTNVVVLAPTEWRTVPFAAAPAVPTPQSPWIPPGMTLTDICVSRT